MLPIETIPEANKFSNTPKAAHIPYHPSEDDPYFHCDDDCLCFMHETGFECCELCDQGGNW